MKYIEAEIILKGAISPRKLNVIFGSSTASATRDIARYSELAPGQLKYDHHRKQHQSAPEFRPHYFIKDSHWTEQAKQFQDAVHIAFGIFTI